MEYSDLDLLIAEDQVIRADSEQGEVSERFQLDLHEVALALQLVEQGTTNEALLKSLGGRLFQALFPGDVGAHLRASAAAASVLGRGLRLRLAIEPPELSALPWEFLYDADTNTFVANSTATVLSRYIGAPMARRDIRAASLPLRVMVVISSPRDLPALDVAGEERLIREALAGPIADGRVQLDVVNPATIRNINHALRATDYHVFHFVGHGAYDGREGRVALEEEGLARLVDDETFSNFFLGNRTLGLVLLNACQGAVSSSRQALAGVAPHLVLRGIPAVVAMRYEVLDSTAKLFADEFYSSIALSWPVDAAVQAARNAISMEVGLGRRDFATPVLFMRARDGVILEIASQTHG